MAVMQNNEYHRAPDLNLLPMAGMHSHSYQINTWFKLITNGLDAQPLLPKECLT